MSASRLSALRTRLLGERSLPWIVAAVVIAIGLAGLAAIDGVVRDNDRQSARLLILDRLTAVRARLEGTLNSTLLLSHGLASVIATNPEVSRQELASIGRELLAGQPQIENISIARDLVVTQSIARDGAEHRLGQKILEIVDFREAIQRAIGRRQDVLAGPFAEPNGHLVLAGRTPVFLAAAAADRSLSPLWGVITLVIDAERLFADAGLNDPNLPIQIAIRGKDGLGPFGAVFLGDENVFAGDGVQLDVVLPGGRWQVAAIRKPGAGLVATHEGPLRILGLLVTLLSAALSFAMTRSVVTQRHARERLHAIVAATPFAGGICRSSDGKILYANASIGDYFGLPQRDILGRGLVEFLADPADGRMLIDGASQLGGVRGREVRLRRSGGGWALAAASPMTYDGEQAVFVAFSDLTAFRAQQSRIEQLVAHERTLAAVLHLALQSGSLDEFLSQALDHVSGFISRLPGARCCGFELLPAGEETPTLLTRVVGSPLSSDQAAACCVALAGALPAGLTSLPSSTGCGKFSCHRFPVSLGEVALGAVAVGVEPGSRLEGEDLTFLERIAEALAIGLVHRRAEREIANLAFRDPLTNLPNRRMLMGRLQHEISVAARLGIFGAVLYIDLDRFKNLNDALGHSFGDSLLLQVGQRLCENLRESDTVSRVGGDEFVVLLPGLSHSLPSAATGAYNTAEKLRHALSAPYDLNGPIHHLTPSIGLALFPHDASDVEGLLKHADTAMYHSKLEGRNTIRFFEPSMQAAAERRLALENELRQALGNGEFSLAYQPLVLADKRVAGAEALLRWRHPVRGNVPPNEFIPVAEETGLIVEIGRWVLETAVAQVKTWEDAGILEPGQHVAVNISPRQFHQQDFSAMVGEIIRDRKVDPARIVLEITEGVLIKDPVSVVSKMEELHGTGVRFYIDDFGTGYSSMSYLKRLPVHGLKIDQSFVRDLGVDPSDGVIIEAIIGLARRFNLVVVAEGVETEAQLAFLNFRGCTTFQGYHFSRPIPPESFAELYLQGVGATA